MSEIFLPDDLRLTPSPIRIGDKRLELLTVENIEPFIRDLEEKGNEALKSFPYWVKVWEASLILASHIIDEGLDPGKTVLELGAGMGVVGLFLAAYGHPVTLTDFNADALALMKKNAERNGLTSVSIRKLDWNHPDLPGKYDIVCGAELVYRQPDIQPLLKTVRNAVQPEGTVYLAHNIRQISMIGFLAEAGNYFEIDHAGKSITMGGEKKQVVVHTMTPKK